MQEALQNIFEEQGHKIRIHVAELMENTQYVPFTEKDTVRWDQVECLYIGNIESTALVPKREIPRGIYVSRDGSWVLIFTDVITGYSPTIARCADRLTKLFISGKIEGDIDVSSCDKLQSISVYQDNIFDNRSYVRGIQSLGGLKNLILVFVGFESELDVMQMPELEKLILQGGPFDSSGLFVRGVQTLRALKGLLLSQVSWGGKMDVSALTELKVLQLSSKKQHGDDQDWVTGVSHLTNLKYLELNCGFPEASLDVSWLVNLEYLAVRGNKMLTGVTGLENLRNLEHIDLRYTGIRAIPEGIRGLTKLKELNLSRLELDELPDWLPELGLPISMGRYDGDGISLYGTKVPGVDMRIFNQPQEVILQWFEERKRGSARPLNEVKVVFLGDGEAGKTHTITRLLSDGAKPTAKNFDGKATPGIVIKNKEYELDGRKIQVHFWDFGGQEILHSMHRMFLTERTLYVVIINARDDTQNERARYWLHNIQSFAPNAPVLLVLNKIDQNPNASIDMPELQKKYKGLRQEVRMSALEYDTARFNEVFTAALMAQVKALDTHAALWPDSWLKLKKGLETMKTNYIHGSDYEELCEKSGVEQSREELLHWFNDLGVSFCYGGSAKLEDYVILKPEWLTNAIYIILFNKCEETKNGIIPLSAINRMLKKPKKGQDEIRRVLKDVFYDPLEVDYVMDVIRKFRLSFQVREKEEFIPVLCQRESMPVAEEYANDPDTLEFTMDYEYLPDNVIHRLMVEMRNDLDTENVWRTGARFVQAGTACSAVVRSEGNLLRIYVRSRNPMFKPNTYLHIIKGNIDRINDDMKLQKPFCEVIYKADGIEEAFDYEDLLFALREGEETYRSRDRRRRVRYIPIQDILNQSGRTAEIELNELRNDIITACMQLQGNSKFWDATEDEWNTAIRDALRNMGHLVNDQTFQGIGGGGKRSGELDLEIRKDPNIPWTIYEALKIRDKTKTKWNEHLEKLLDNYNPSGLNYLFLVTYVHGDKDNFQGIWDSFSEHIKWYNPGRYTILPSSFTHIPLHAHSEPNYIRAAKITYDRSGSPTTVCHIFARMGG